MTKKEDVMNPVNKYTGNKEKLIEDEKKSAKWISQSTVQLKDGRLATQDPFLISVEIHNPNTFKVVIESLISGSLIIIPPKKNQYFPHQYFTPWKIEKGKYKDEPIPLVVNMGSKIGKGNTKPSRPEVKKKLF